MITADQILAHLVGDYVLQSDWMAENKTRSSFAAGVHALLYSTPFLLLQPTPSVTAWAVIAGSHFLVDRFRLARLLCWAKNHIGPKRLWPPLTNTGYDDSKPVWLVAWLVVIMDNTLHLICNGLALLYL